jgi:hypothetical protein
MNTAEFLSRWSHRKRRATALAESANARGRSAPSAVDGDTAKHNASRPREACGDVEPTGNAAGQTMPARDLANLVPLESIGAETDIRAFLAAGVPPELTRAALRRAWLSDPKIRNFVGLADYDWDFNTPGSMAGFGILDASEQIERELARLVRRTVAVTTGEASISRPPIGEVQTSHPTLHSASSYEPGRRVRLHDESAASDRRPE